MIEKAHKGALTHPHGTVDEVAITPITTTFEEDSMEVGIIVEWTTTIHQL